MIILELTIVEPGSAVGKKIGNPQTLSEDSSSSSAPPPPVKLEPTKSSAPTIYTPKPMDNTGANLDSSILSSQMTHPIASLSPYQNK